MTATEKNTADRQWKAHYSFAISRINTFQQNPAEYRQDELLSPPPGQPIGETLFNYCGEY